MKNILSLAVIYLLLSARAQAQLTLLQSSYPSSVLGTDSLRVTTASSAFPALLPGANASWDLSAVTDSTPVLFDYRVAATGHQYADSSFYRFYTFDYQGNVLTDITSSGIVEDGIDIQEAKYNLASLTGNFLDTFTIDAQTMLFSAPETKIAFPATYNNSWSSNYYSDLNFKLTYIAFADTLAPGIIRTYTSEKDSVTGWGKMRIKDASGSPSVYLSVLQVQATTIHTDSFFLKGAPLGPSLLTTFNVTQGGKDTVYEQKYYRTGEVTPLATVRFHDAAFTQPYKAVMHTQRLEAVSVNDVIGNNSITLYPNPAASGSVFIRLPSSTGQWSYLLRDISGRQLARGPVNTSLPSIQLPPALAHGIYYLHILNDGAIFAVKAVEID